jgi:uncharacterized repeat protein (TIGR01451 family)
VAACLVGLWADPAGALGTAAGATITNTCTVDYTVSGIAQSETASNSFDVLEVIDCVVTWQDAANVSVNTPHSDRVLTLQLTNTGNGPEDFRLAANAAVAGDDFNPSVQDLYLESNGTAGLQMSGATPDTIYAGTDIALAADGTQLCYIVSTIPGGLVVGNIGRVELLADAQTPGAAGSTPGTVLPNAGPGGVDAIVGTTGADGSAAGIYEVSFAAVALVKSIAQIADPYGGDRPYPGAVVTYRITVDVSGSGTAEAVVISDTIPADMTYVAGSIQLDGVAQTDADDAPTDASDFGVTTANTITVNLGDTVAPATRTIEFNTTIN